jgi:BNR/Asp-box repeat
VAGDEGGFRDRIDALHDRIELDDLVSNRIGLCTVQTGLFPGKNRKATSSSAQECRSESAVAINPLDEQNMVGASKKFIDPAVYHFKLAPIYTFDGGVTWHESVLPMEQGWDGMTDPTVAFDSFGHAFLVGEPLQFDPQDIEGLGMAVYRSSDGGVTWEKPFRLTTTTSDDKQWVLCDNNPGSPHYGNVYILWAASSPLRFARSTDHGASWKGRGNDAPGTTLIGYAFAPDISISTDGTLHILWHMPGSNSVQYLRSTDGGATFEPIKEVVTGLVGLSGNLPATNGWPHFDGGKFRVLTLVTSCTAPGGRLIVAWADMREGRSRIYYRRSDDKGVTWQGPASGQPLLPNVTYGDFECFHPQIVCTTATGVVGCSFYVFGKWQGSSYRIHVQLAASWDLGTTFSQFVTVTDEPWDPLVDAPFSHGDPQVHFIGEYFGLDAGRDSFAVLWTDTRTGVQELFSDNVATKKITCPHIPELVAQILVGVVQDGGGWVIIGGKLHKVPPRGPLVQVLEALAEEGELETADVEAIEKAVGEIRG